MLRQRPNWDFYFMAIAQVVATRSRDPSSQIGAVLVNPAKRIVATGYNGFPSGIADHEHRWLTREEKLKYVVHAERNAFLSAAFSGNCTEGSTLFIHPFPTCSECAKDAIQVGVIRVVSPPLPPDAAPRWKEDMDFARELLLERRITITEMPCPT